MADHSLLLDLLHSVGIATDDLVAQFLADASATLTELGITDRDMRDATLAELKTLANTVLLDTYRAEALAANADTDPVAYVYLGPNDGVTRPFCEELVGTWLDSEEIRALDNGTGIDAFTGGGGWNCRHQWLPLYGDQTSEYEHGDVEAANAEAA